MQSFIRGGVWAWVVAVAMLAGCASSAPEAVWPEQEVNIKDMQANRSLRAEIPPPAKDLVRDRSRSSTVVLQLHVDAQGNLLRARVSQTSHNAVLDEAALKAVQGMSFIPYFVGGATQPVTVLAPMTFPFFDRPR